MRKYLLFTSLLTLCFVINASAQTADVYGNIKTSDSKPVEAATLSLLKAKDSSLIKIAVADKTGAYRFDRIQYANYLVQAEAVGQDKGVGQIFEINNSKPSF